MAISMFPIVSAISFPIDEELHNKFKILGIILYMLTNAIGAAPVTGLIILEFSSSSRTHGEIMSLIFSVCNFMVGLFFLELLERFSVAPVYGSFGAVSLLAALFSYMIRLKRYKCSNSGPEIIVGKHNT